MPAFVSRRTCDPSGFITKRLSRPAYWRMNAMNLPSSEAAGERSVPGRSSVGSSALPTSTRNASVPSARICQSETPNTVGSSFEVRMRVLPASISGMDASQASPT